MSYLLANRDTLRALAKAYRDQADDCKLDPKVGPDVSVALWATANAHDQAANDLDDQIKAACLEP